MSALSEILSSIKASGVVYFCDQLTPPWEIDQGKEHSAAFHYVRRGQCWLEFEGHKQLVNAGDLIFLGAGDGHRLYDLYQGDETLENPPATHLLCGYFEFKASVPDPIIHSFPRCLVLREEELSEFRWLRLTLEHLGTEFTEDAPGASVVVDKLTEILLVEILRFYISHYPNAGYIAALFDSQIGKALKLIHEQPQKSWTLESLAEASAMSRAVFAKRFKSLVGEPMFPYLTQVRMRLAQELLLHPNSRVGDVAEQVGYQSELAFTKVFKQHVGHTPVAWKKSNIEASALS